MMLPSPATSTPFSVKDILKLEQQRLGGPLEPPFPAAALASCLLGCRFSDGEDDDEDEEKLPFLNSMAAAKSPGDAALSPGSYVQAVLRGTCKPKGLVEEGEPARDSEAGESQASVARVLGHRVDEGEALLGNDGVLSTPQAGPPSLASRKPQDPHAPRRCAHDSSPFTKCAPPPLAQNTRAARSRESHYSRLTLPCTRISQHTGTC